MKTKLLLPGVLLLPVLFLSCSKNEPERPLSALEARGKTVFNTNCIACHNPDPRYAGSVGPAIAGSSLELITERVMRQAYPPGYKPLRTTKLMPPLPFLEADLPALHAYLNSFKK